MVNRRLQAQARSAFLLATIGVFLAGAGSASGQVISSVAAPNVTDNSAVITWTTNISASSLVNYGVTTSYGSLSALNPALVTTHSVTLNDAGPAQAVSAGGNTRKVTLPVPA